MVKSWSCHCWMSWNLVCRSVSKGRRTSIHEDGPRSANYAHFPELTFEKRKKEKGEGLTEILHWQATNLKHLRKPLREEDEPALDQDPFLAAEQLLDIVLSLPVLLVRGDAAAFWRRLPWLSGSRQRIAAPVP